MKLKYMFATVALVALLIFNHFSAIAEPSTNAPIIDLFSTDVPGEVYETAVPVSILLARTNKFSRAEKLRAMRSVPSYWVNNTNYREGLQCLFVLKAIDLDDQETTQMLLDGLNLSYGTASRMGVDGSYMVLHLLYQTNAQEVVRWYIANYDKMQPEAYCSIIYMLCDEVHFTREGCEVLVLLTDDKSMCLSKSRDSVTEPPIEPYWAGRVCDSALNALNTSLKTVVAPPDVDHTHIGSSTIPQRDTNIWAFKLWWSRNKDAVIARLPSVTEPYTATRVNARGWTNVISRGPLMSLEDVEALKAKLRTRIQSQ